jgi:hypothetical protein
MKAKLIKRDSDYFLEVEYWYPKFKYPTIVANTLDKPDGLVLNLSKQNCDEIFGIVNVEELAQEVCDDTISSPYHCYIAGFNKNAELNKDKVFTKQDMFDIYAHIVKNGIISGVEANEYIQSLQQPTEIEVEIVTDSIPADRAPNGWDTFPKLDPNGCLILKRI